MQRSCELHLIIKEYFKSGHQLCLSNFEVTFHYNAVTWSSDSLSKAFWKKESESDYKEALDVTYGFLKGRNFEKFITFYLVLNICFITIVFFFPGELVTRQKST